MDVKRAKSPEEFPVQVTLPVTWGDMDAFNHVNNVVYFKWFESARIAYFENTQTMGVMKAEGIGPILASTSCRYRLPLTYPDTITVCARIAEMGEDRFVMHYAVFSEQYAALAAYGDGVVVMVNYDDSKKTAIPDEVRSAIQNIEGLD